MLASSGTWFGIALALLAAGAQAAWSAPDSVSTVPAGVSAPVETARTSSVDPSDQALFFMPTAFLPPAGAFTFRDFELLFLTFGYSPGARTSLSLGFLFPVLPSIQVGTLGFKQNLWSDGSGAALSITGNLTQPLGEGPPDDVGFFANSNLVASKRLQGPDGKEHFGIHGAVGYLGHRERYTKYRDTEEQATSAWKWQGDFDYGIGCDAVLTPHAKFLVEYVSAAPFEADNSFKGGLLSFGFRLHGERLAADIAGLRPFTGTGVGEIFLWPLLVVSYRI
jgi:hypothetical protein